MKVAGLAGFLVVLSALLPCQVDMQKERKRATLSLDIQLMKGVARSGGPLPVTLTAKWSGVGAPELIGRFSLVVQSSGAVLGRVVTAEMVLTTGPNVVHLMFPPLEKPAGAPPPWVDVRFESKNLAVDLGSFLFPISGPHVHTFVVGICGALHRGLDLTPLKARIALEAIDPDLGVRTGFDTRTRIVSLLPEEMPDAPLGLCAYDMVVADDTVLADLETDQSTALHRWVEGGGSLCLITAGKGAGKKDIAAFLRPWADAASSVPGIESARVQMVQAELGRVVWLAVPPDRLGPFLETYSWRRIARFLWRYRGRAFLQKILTPMSPVQSDTLETELIQVFLPRNIRLPSTVLLLVLLAGFLLVIGPIDFLLVRSLRRRWLTWFLFPTVSIVFSVVMMRVSVSALGKVDHHRRLDIVDVGQGGVVLRRNRLEGFMPGAAGERKELMRRAVHIPLNVRTPIDRGEAKRSSFATWEGTFPLRYVVTEPMTQWQPRVYRTFSFDRTPPVVAVKRIVSSLVSTRSCVRPQGVIAAYLVRHLKAVPLFEPKMEAVNDFDLDALMAWIESVSVRDANSPVFRLSPTGGPGVEDLTLTGASGHFPSRPLLLVVTREDGVLTIHRRLLDTKGG